jgi:hypothetical protein
VRDVSYGGSRFISHYKINDLACADQPDIIDEAISFFKANVLFRNYEVKGPADRVLIYLTLYISQAINQMVNQSKGGAQKNLFNLAIQNFSVPGDKNFALAGFVSNPANRAEAGTLHSFIHPPSIPRSARNQARSCKISFIDERLPI